MSEELMAESLVLQKVLCGVVKRFGAMVKLPDDWGAVNRTNSRHSEKKIVRKHNNMIRFISKI